MAAFDRLGWHLILLHSVRLHSHVVLVALLHLCVPGDLLSSRHVIVDHWLLTSLYLGVFDFLYGALVFEIVAVIQNACGWRLRLARDAFLVKALSLSRGGVIEVLLWDIP